MFELHVAGWHGDAGDAVAEAAAALGLHITADTTLTKYPGSRHWHLKRGKTAGTLEVTCWPQEQRLWVSFQANRAGDGWVPEAAPRLAAALAGALGGSVVGTVIT